MTMSTTEAGGMEAGREPGDLLHKSFWETERTIPHEEAREIAKRFVDGHFGNANCEHPRTSIPANPDRDDDLLLNTYIKQQARKEAALATARPDESLERLREALRQIKARTYSNDRGCALSRVAVAEVCDIATAALSHPSQTAGVAEGTITEAMIEAACRAAGAVEWPQADLDMQMPSPFEQRRTCSIWESYRIIIEPALKAALDRAAAPQSDPLVTIGRKDGKPPCGECHLHPGETCDICGAINTADSQPEHATPQTCPHMTDHAGCLWLSRTWSTSPGSKPTRCAGCPDRAAAPQSQEAK